MELSQAMMRQANKLKAPIQYVVMADLVQIGYSEADAYTIAYPENAALSPKQNNSVRENIFSSEKFKKVLSNRTHGDEDIDMTGDEEALMDKNNTARMIMKAAMQQPANSKERIEGLMKYADLMGYKKEDAGEVSENIMFAFPIKCYQCPLLYSYNEFRKNNGDKELRPIEMERIIQFADGIIRKAMKKG